MKSKEQKVVLFHCISCIGHINPLIGIADKLKDECNFRTIFLIPGPVNLTAIEEHGHELLVIGHDSLNRVCISTDPKDIYTSKTDINESFNRTIKLLCSDPKDAWAKISEDENGFVSIVKRRMVKDHALLEKLINNIKPDLIIIDTIYTPPCIVNLIDIPWVYVCSSNPLCIIKARSETVRPPFWIGAILWNKNKREEARRNDPEKWNQLIDSWRGLNEMLSKSNKQIENFDKLYLDNGLKPREAGPDCYISPYLNLYQFPKELDYDQDDDLFEYPKRWFRCDNLIRKPVDKTDSKEAKIWNEKLDEAMKGKKELVYFSLGTIASAEIGLMKRYIDMFSTDTQRLYVISKGVNGDSLELNPENMIGEKYVPQTLILKRANLAIIHGGNNSILECLSNAVPLIVIPCYGDQCDNAQRIDDLQLGKKLNAFTSTEEELFQAMDQVLYDSSIVERLKVISQNMQSRNDLNKLVFMLRRLAEEKKLDVELIDECRS